MCSGLEREYGLLLLFCLKLGLRGISFRTLFFLCCGIWIPSLLLVGRMGWMVRIALYLRALGPSEQRAPRKAKSFLNLCTLGRGWFKGIQSAVEIEVLTGASIVWRHGRPGGHAEAAVALVRAQKGLVEEAAGSHLLLINIMYYSWGTPISKGAQRSLNSS